MKKEINKDEHRIPSLALVLGYLAIKDLQRLEDRVSLLTRLGYGNREIASICGTTSGAVKTLKSKSKKGGKKK